MNIPMRLVIIYWEVSIVTIIIRRGQKMRTVDEYMKLPYKMEIVSDTEEGIRVIVSGGWTNLISVIYYIAALICIL